MRLCVGNSATFGALYGKYQNFSPKQRQYVAQINNEFARKEYQGNKTVLEKWEDLGYDFLLKNKKEDSVSLYAITRNKKGVPQMEKQTYIGEYNDKKQFDNNYIDIMLNADYLLKSIASIVGALVIATCTLFCMNRCSDVSAETKKEVPVIMKSSAKNICSKIAQFK